MSDKGPTCTERVNHGRTRLHPCGRRARYDNDTRCKVHSAEAVEARRAKWSAKWDAKHAAAMARYARESAAANLYALAPAILAALPPGEVRDKVRGIVEGFKGILERLAES